MTKHTVEKSPSDSTVMVKPPSHCKAVSDNKLEQVQSQDHRPSKGSKSSGLLTAKLPCDVAREQTGCGMEQTVSKNTPSQGNVTLEKAAQQSIRQRKVFQHSQPSCQEKDNSHGSFEEGKLKLSEQKPLTVNEEKTDTVKEPRKGYRMYFLCWITLTLLSLITRLHNIEIPSHICWDETHFGKMGSWYINRTFFFDVHPPLGKMLIGLAGLATGYDGSFLFEKPGDPYGDTNYVGMRMFCAVLGAFLVPLTFQSVWLLTHSVLAALFAGIIVLLDTGTLTLSRHILLDPILMFFILLSLYCCLKALSYKHRSFCFMWWLWMSATGVSLACAISVKFVGLFIVLFVGYTTATDLWVLLGDLSLSMVKLFAHLSARALCLIVLPMCVYCFFFAVHFQVLNRSGSGDGFFSSAFQSQLIGNRLYNVSMPQYIAYGSEITLKQRRTGGAYLHSHSHLYPEDYPPRQQQVTTYSHKDDNNLWCIKPANRELAEGDYATVNFVHSGDLVRLEHIVTRRNLHSHKEPAPLTKHNFQVSGYGQNGSGDANDIWMVEVEGASKGDKIQTVRSKIRFIHYNVGCLLHSHDKKLPKWGWEQMEVTCQTDLRDATSAWNVEEVVDSRLSNVSFHVYSPSFLEKFIESHAVMTQGNNGLKPKEGEMTSQPWQWPINYRGQMFSGPDHRVYMLGNPVLFWSLLGLKVAFLLLWLGFRVCNKRAVTFSKMFSTYSERTMKVCWWLLLGWALHYVPFWTMSRVLYFHHYFPAFLFSAMFGGVMLDFLLMLVCVCVPTRLAQQVFSWSLVFILGAMAWSLYLFHPLVYGMAGPTSSDKDSIMHGLKWLESWDF